MFDGSKMMPEPQGKTQQSLETRVRRRRIALIIAGRGVILFGLWTLVRTILMITLSGDSVIRQYVGNGGDMTNLTPGIVYICLIIIACIDVILRLFVGLSAISEGKGRKVRYVYLVLAFIMAIFAVTDYFLRVYGLYKGYYTHDYSLSHIAERIVDLTSLITTIDLIVQSFSLKKLMKEQG